MLKQCFVSGLIGVLIAVAAHHLTLHGSPPQLVLRALSIFGFGVGFFSFPFVLGLGKKPRRGRR